MVMYKTLPGLVGYRISSDGHVYTRWQLSGRGNVLGTQWRRLKGTQYRYQRVRIRRFGVVKWVMVHRLVLEAFVGPCPTGLEGYHNNGNKLDNRVENLRWDTRASNRIDSYDHGGHKSGEAHHWTRISDETVVEMKKLVKKGMSYRAIEKKLGLPKDYVSGCMCGRMRVRR